MNTNIDMFIESLSEYCSEKCAEYMFQYRKICEDIDDKGWIDFWQKLCLVENDRARLVFGHDCLCHVQRGEIFEEYLRILKDTNVINWDNKYYLLWQVTGIMFGKTVTPAPNIEKYSYEIYHQILQDYKALLENVNWIRKEERNDSLIFVLVEQFLDFTHGPTKTTMDRARVLHTKMGKSVIVVNTAEQYGGSPIELAAPMCANYNKELLQQEFALYEEVEYPFIQFANNMPNILNGNEFLQFIEKYKPAFIVNIGGQSLLADTSAQLVPVININTVPSDIVASEATAQMTGKMITEEDIQLLALIGKTQDDVIRGRFTSSLKTQEHHFTRNYLGIPENRLILVVVGGRLASEVDDRFIEMIEPVLEAGAFLVVIGAMNTYETMCEKHKIFSENSKNLGMQEDVLAVLECCDLYVNPDRIGGGTSVIEAMYKKCPAVSLNHGDVALGVGTEFCVETYEQMTAELLRYINDTTYYQEKAEKAQKRAAYMLDSDTAFTEIINTFVEKFCNQ